MQPSSNTEGAISSTVVAFGETLWDLLPTGALLGGAPFNFAYRLNTLGVPTSIATRLGQDALGKAAGEQITALGMPAACVQWDPIHPTGTVEVTFHPDGSHDFTILPEVAYDYIEVTALLREHVAAAGCLCFGTVAQRAPTSRRTLHQLLDAMGDRLKLLDINLRKDCYTPEIIATSIKRCDILKLNEDETDEIARMFAIAARALPDFCADVSTRWSLSCCLITLGERGALAGGADRPPIYVPGYQVDTVDTVGSGDAFTAGFLHRWLRGMPLADCCRFGNILGAMVAGQRGATAPMDTSALAQFEQPDAPRIFDNRFHNLCVL